MPDIFVSSRQQARQSKKQSSVWQIKEKVKQKNLVKKRKQVYGLGPRYQTVVQRLAKKRRKSFLNSFCILPGKVRFETQEMKEKVVLLLRQHWLTQVGWLVTGLIMLWLPIGLFWIPVIDFMPSNYQFMSLVMWYLLVIAFVYEKFITWFFHVFIITDERIIDINFYNLLYKEVSEAKIDNIEDVTYRQGGVVRAMFDYGDVAMQTAGEKREFMIESVPSPSRVVKILNELKLEEEHEKIMGRVR